MSIDAIGDRGAQWHLKVAKAISIYLAIHPTKKSRQFDVVFTKIRKKIEFVNRKK